jgi:hypothetical protein
MTQEEMKLVAELADAYRILREAYHHDMHKEPPAKTDLQKRIDGLLAAHVLRT